MDTANNLSIPGVSNRRQWMVRAGIATGGFVFVSSRLRALSDDGISRTAEAIHQETVFNAGAKRVYEALMNAQQFQKVQELSAAMKSVDVSTKPAMISAEPGGTFFLFGGYISGRHVELVPNQRIVQAWRAMSWEPGVYSIARFELTEQAGGTKLVFDHRGFPTGESAHLASGWKSNYWEPLAKFLA